MAKRKTKKTKISNILPYSDEIAVAGGRKRKLVFDNRMLGYAEQYCKEREFELTAEEILQEAASVKVRAIYAVLFGALRSGNETYSLSVFNKEFRIDRIALYIEKIAKGLTEFLPESEKAYFPDEYKKSDEGGDMIGDYFDLARSALGMTDEEILDSSLRAIETKIKNKYGIDDDSNEGFIDSVPGF